MNVCMHSNIISREDEVANEIQQMKLNNAEDVADDKVQFFHTI
jgi:hypothetical protein